jgi:hypothetical protein
MARPAPMAFLLCLVLGLAAVVWQAKEGADAAHLQHWQHRKAVGLGGCFQGVELFQFLGGDLLEGRGDNGRG